MSYRGVHRARSLREFGIRRALVCLFVCVVFTYTFDVLRYDTADSICSQHLLIMCDVITHPIADALLCGHRLNFEHPTVPTQKKVSPRAPGIPRYVDILSDTFLRYHT